MTDVGVLQDTKQTSFLYKNKRAQRKLSVGGSRPLSLLKSGKCYQPAACVHARPSFLGAKLNLHCTGGEGGKITQPGLNKLTGGPSYRLHEDITWWGCHRINTIQRFSYTGTA